MDPTVVLNRPALLVGALAVSVLAGYAFGRARGAVRGALLAVAAWGLLVAAKAVRWLPDAGGWFAAGVGVALVAGVLAWRAPWPRQA